MPQPAGPSIEPLVNALSDTFTDQFDLEEFVSLPLGERTEHIVGHQVNLRVAIRQVIEAAIRERWISDLLQEGQGSSPQLPHLQQACNGC